jgi:hypothetical protein
MKIFFIQYILWTVHCMDLDDARDVQPEGIGLSSGDRWDVELRDKLNGGIL